MNNLPKIARVFARRTRATPIGPMVFDGPPPFYVEANEVQISVTFTWDMEHAEWLAKQWQRVAQVRIGGPGTDKEPGGEFTPGKFLRDGYVITSRGCGNKCWFCKVPRREGPVRELPITTGWNVLDNNLLQCSEQHVRSVFNMLRTQDHPIEFTGGFEALRLRPWHVELLKSIRLKQMFFAWDTADDLEPLEAAGRMLLDSGFTAASHKMRCYVLCGFTGDTFALAARRLMHVIDIGFWPMPMLFQDDNGRRLPEWITFQSKWCNPHKLKRQIALYRGNTANGQPTTVCRSYAVK